MIKPEVSIVLGTYNRLSFLKLAIESIRQELLRAPFHAEIIVIDGGSTDGTGKWLGRQKDILSIVQHNHGEWHGKKIERRSWGYFMNLCFKCAQGKYICMLSDDCLVLPYAIINGFTLFEGELSKGRKIGAVAFYWRNWPEQKKYWVGLTFGNKLFVNHGMYLNDALKDVDFADEDTFTFYHADGDLCLKLWQHGYICIDSPRSFIEHYAHANRRLRISNLSCQNQDWDKYRGKWETALGKPDRDWIEREHVDTTNSARKFFWRRFGL